MDQDLSRADSWEMFPAGLKVLVVDDDPLCLKVVEHMLRRCNYQGGAPSLAPWGQVVGGYVLGIGDFGGPFARIVVRLGPASLSLNPSPGAAQ
jgi:hypothetical protein